jgi:hypothetical protein
LVPAGAEQAARDQTVRKELDRILSSTAFRSSRRSQEFLRYVVINTLEGRMDLLKERVIGINVFQRDPDYDTGDDSIVRVKASDLRKRLAQYQMEAGLDGPLQIVLPAGSYVPEFRWGKGEGKVATPPPPEPEGPGFDFRLLGMAALIVCAASGLMYLARGPSTMLDAFWAPVLNSPRPVLICVASPTVFRLTPSARALLQENPKPPSVPSEDVLAAPDEFMPVGDALAQMHLWSFLERQGKRVQTRLRSDVSFSDLRESSAILVGAFTNNWTLELTQNLRFVFDRDEQGNPLIRDTMVPGKVWRREGANSPVDYAVVTRVLQSRTGGVLITAAGIQQDGTRIAGELLTHLPYLEEALKGAPGDWRHRNLQWLLACEVIQKSPGPPRVVASWYW